MPNPTMFSTAAAISGNNVTLANTNPNKLLIILSLGSTNDYTSPTVAVTVGGVAATSLNYARHESLFPWTHLNVSYIKAADCPANGSRAFVATWSSAVQVSRHLVIEANDVDQTTPLADFISALGSSVTEPYTQAITFAGGKAALLVGAIAGSSYCDDTGYITSTPLTNLGTTLSGSPNERMDAIFDPSVVAGSRTYNITSRRNSGSTAADMVIAVAVGLNAIPSPSIVNIDGDNTVNQNQQNVVIQLGACPVSVASVIAKIGASYGAATALTGVTWNGDQTVTVDIPSNLTAGAGQNLYVDYTE